jgi:hypothetical protein
MSLVVVELLDALKAAGVDDEKARAAASAVAGKAVQDEARFGAIEGRLTLLTWMVSVLAAAMVVVGLPALWLLVRIAAKVGVGF